MGVEQDGDERVPLLTSVVVVCREFPRVVVEQRVMRRIESFLDGSTKYPFMFLCGMSLGLVKRAFARMGWDRDRVVEGIYEAASDGKLDVVQWLCAMGELEGHTRTIDLVNEAGPWYMRLQWNGSDPLAGYPPLSVAASWGHISVVQWLTDVGAIVDQQDEEGQTALHQAAFSGHLLVVQWLVDKGASLTIKDEQGCTPLHEASRSGSLPVVQYLLTKVSKTLEEDDAGPKSLHLAAEGGHLPVVRCLAERCDIITLKDREGRTALHCTANGEEGNLELVKFLVENGCQPFDTDNWGHTALYGALIKRHYDIVYYFVKECSSEKKPPSPDLLRCLLVSASADWVDLMEYLQRHLGVDLYSTNAHGRTALHEACAGGASNAIEFLLHGCENVDVVDSFGITPMMEACRNGKTSAVHQLLEAGVSLGGMDLAGQIALHFGAKSGSKSLVEMLLRHKADIDHRDTRGWRPIHCAAAAGRTEVVKALVVNGASVEADTVTGRNPAQVAAEFGHIDIFRYLKKLQAVGVNQSFADTAVDILEVAFDPDDDYETEGVWLDSKVEMKKTIGATNFFEELNRWSRLNHPHIVQLYGVCRGNATLHTGPSFVYEQPTQGSLLEYLEMTGNTTNSAEIWNKLYEAALGLRYLHDRNVIHGDISCYSIVIAANGVAKIRNLGSENVPKPHHLAYTSPEMLAGLPPSFETDVYAFGMTIVEALKDTPSIWGIHGPELQDAILSGNLPPKPEAMTMNQWKLVERMCCYDPRRRLSLAGVVRELEVIVNEYEMSQEKACNTLSDDMFADNVVDQDVLCLVDNIDESIKASDPMHEDLYDRLVNVIVQLKKQNDAPTKRTFQQLSQIIVHFHRQIQSTNIGCTQEWLLASSRQIADDVFILNKALDSFMDGMGISRSAELHRWGDKWRIWQTQQLNEMLNVLQEEPDVLAKVDETKSFSESLQYLSFELSRYSTTYSKDKLVDFSCMASCIKSLANSTSANWFIPAYEVDFDRFNEFSRGAFGKVFHGMWKRSRVVVKTVKLRNEVDQAAFLNEIDIWSRLYHPHVVQLFGACHIGQPFFVCEYAGGGQLDDYLRGHSNEVWSKLYEAALGLRYLHVKHVIHGDLKCNNILIGSDGLAKLTDFGLSTLNTVENSETESGDASKVGAIRWKAPEVLRGEKATFASDVYSFAMCILEAVSGRYPWGMTLDPVVKYFVLQQKRIPQRPEHCSEAMYALVQQMSRFDPTDRVQMSEVVDTLKTFC